jgi:hypothetical protein
VRQRRVHNGLHSISRERLHREVLLNVPSQMDPANVVNLSSRPLRSQHCGENHSIIFRSRGGNRGAFCGRGSAPIGA